MFAEAREYSCTICNCIFSLFLLVSLARCLSDLLIFFFFFQRTKSVVVQSLNHIWLFVTPWIAAFRTLFSSTISWSLLKFLSPELVMLSNHHGQMMVCGPLLHLPSVFFSFRVFSNELVLHIRRSKYQSFSFSNSPSNAYSGLISFMIHWCDLAVHRTLKCLLQHHSLKAFILWHSVFFMGQLLHLYMTTGKTNFGYMELCQQSDVSAF